jgi:hypothetical protein
MTTCLQCGKETNNPKFCSRSCSASYNNRVSPKRTRTNTCKACGTLIVSDRTYCKRCFTKDWSKIRKKDLKVKQRYQVHSHIRNLARNAYMKAGLPRKCAICGYDLHIDICHIKPIKDFPDDAYIADINDTSNLIALCKNHHWELDHGLFILPT